jgi:hypothetical protein
LAGSETGRKIVTDLFSDLKPSRNAGVTWREEEEDVFICSEDGQTLFTITSVGADIWRICDGEHSLGEMAELLVAAYDVDRETVDRDIQDFLTDMKSRGLVFF